MYRRIEEINSHPEVLKKISKFDGANFRGLDYLNPRSERDSICRISADTIFEIVKIKKTCVIGNEHVISFLDDISRPECFFDREPVLPRSSTLGLYVSLGLSPQPKRWAKNLFDSAVKYVKLPFDDKFLLLPVLHTTHV